MSFVVYLLGSVNSSEWEPVFKRGPFTVVEIPPGSEMLPRPSSSSSSSTRGKHALVIAEMPFDPMVHHPSWESECFLVRDDYSGGPMRDRPGMRARRLPPIKGDGAAVREAIVEYLDEFASGAELRDALRNLKRIITEEENRIQTVDDITAMTLHEKVRIDLNLRTVRIDGVSASASPPSILGLTPPGPGQQPDLVVSILPNVPVTMDAPLTVYLIQPLSDTIDDLVDLWANLKSLDDQSIMYLPPGTRLDDPLVPRLVALSLLRKQRPAPANPRAPRGFQGTLEAIERASMTLKVNANSLRV